MPGHDTHQQSPVSKFLHDAKEYILGFTALIAAISYLLYYVNKIPPEFVYLKWIAIIIVSLTIFFAYFFSILPAWRRKRALNLKPTGNPEQGYFTTSPRTDDKYHFFTSGYEEYITWLRQPKAPVLYLTGLSGSGKSSLINAYIAPRLSEGQQPKTNVFVVRTYHDPLLELYKALSMDTVTDATINAASVMNAIQKASHLLTANEQILIILDQFEEFFLLRNTPEALQQNAEPAETETGIVALKLFFQQFIQQAPKGVHILLSYRDDFQQLIDQLELPARTEHINFKQVKLLTFQEAAAFLKGCPGLTIPEPLLNRILKEATTIDTPITLRPIVLNLLGIILQRMAGQATLPKQEGSLIRRYILDCLGKELQQERATVLKAMLTDFNTARPRSVAELTQSSSLNISQLDNQMIGLQHHGLVRCLDTTESSPAKRKWQIAHDFVALQLEKVVHGIGKTLWQKSKPWSAPVLICVLLIFSASYAGIFADWKRKEARSIINKVGLTMNDETRTISSPNYIALTDSTFQLILPALIQLKPDSLEFKFLDDTTKQCEFLIGLDKVISLKKIVLLGNLSIKSLKGLEGLSALTTLNLGGCARLQNIEALKGLSALTTLNLSSCKSLQNIEALKGLTALTNLDLSYCESLQNIEALKGLIALTDLDLSYCKSLQNIEALKRLTVLTNLDLGDCVSLQNIEALKGLTALIRLDLNKIIRLQNIEALSGLNTLTNLDLSFCGSLQNVEALRGLTALTSLDLSFCKSLQNIEALKGLTALTNLDLNYCTSLQNIEALRGLTALTNLDLSDCDSLQSIEALKGLTALTNLNLSSCDSLQSIEALKGLTALTNLDLSSCRSLQNIEALKGLTALTNLDLSSCYYLKNIEALKGLTALTNLDLSFCEGLQSIEALKELTALTNLDLSSCRSLQNIEALKGLTALTNLDLSSCYYLKNIEVLKRLTALTKLNLSFCSSLQNIDALKSLSSDVIKEIDVSYCSKITIAQIEELKNVLPKTQIED